MAHIHRLKRRIEERSKRKQRSMSTEERSQIAKGAQKWAYDLQRDIEKEWEKQDLAAAALAIQYGKKTSWMHSRLQRLPRYTKG